MKSNTLLISLKFVQSEKKLWRTQKKTHTHTDKCYENKRKNPIFWGPQTIAAQCVFVVVFLIFLSKYLECEIRDEYETTMKKLTHTTSSIAAAAIVRSL